jgi:alkylation response protein AidB-like acyl-CoA dehydrogenase
MRPEMEFGWTAEQLEYRAHVRAALAELLPPDWERVYVPQSYASDALIDFSRTFCAQLAARGLLVPHWPKRYGGNDADDWQHFILGEEMKAAGEPRGPQYMNVNWIGPTIMRFGSDEQRREHLLGIASGKVIWCQGFSEPGAGTDLAALKTRAEKCRDHYLINGSKIWTSYARKADWCFLLARTGSGRKDVSVFLVPMSTPGISVSSFPGLIKDGHLNEVFFTDLKVPFSSRLGEEGAGWSVITYALAYERVGVARYHAGLEALDRAIRQLKAENRFDDPVMQSRAGAIVSKFEAARLLTYRVVDQRVHRIPDTTEANLCRIAALEAVEELMDFLVQYVPDCLTDGDALLQDYYRINIPAGITGGTNELQLDLVARRGLGMASRK